MAQAPVPSRVGTPTFACVVNAWTAHEAELRGFLRHHTGDSDIAEDLLQDTFVKAMRAGAHFCELDDPRAWLFRVARNALTDRLRLAKLRDPIDEHADTLAAAESEPPSAVDALTGCVARMLRELSAEDADCLRACDVDGMTQKDYTASRVRPLGGALVAGVGEQHGLLSVQQLVGAATSLTLPAVPGTVCTNVHPEESGALQKISSIATF